MNKPLKLPLSLVVSPAKLDPIFGARPRHELEFLPAALQVIESPPSPLPRVAALCLVSLLGAALTWASLGKVDIISTAPGRIVPSGGGKIVQPLEVGKITAIHVRDGSVVRKGEVLIELEPTETLADQQRLGGELAAAQLEVARLRAVALDEPFLPPAGANPAAIALASRGARAAIEDRTAELAGLDQQLAQRRAELSTAEGELERLAALAPIANQRFEAYQTLERRGFGATLQVLDAQAKAQDATHALEVQKRRIPEIQAAISAAERERAHAAADSAKTDLAALTDAQTKAASLQDELRKAQERVRGRTLVAPVDGAIQELAVHTLGGVVGAGQTLMRIAPSGTDIEVEAKLANKDVGFVRVGMPAAVKVETFPFTKYGTVPAVVTSISRDAAVEEPQPSQRATETPSASADSDPHYIVRLALSRDAVNVDGRTMKITPGMAVTAEIKTGRRRVIEYVLSPLARVSREAGRER